MKHTNEPETLVFLISRNLKDTNEPETYDLSTSDIKEYETTMYLNVMISVLLILRNVEKNQ